MIIIWVIPEKMHVGEGGKDTFSWPHHPYNIPSIENMWVWIITDS